MKHSLLRNTRNLLHRKNSQDAKPTEQIQWAWKGCNLGELNRTIDEGISDAVGTTKQNVAVLGQENWAEAELYSHEAEQERLAVAVVKRVAASFNKLKKQESKTSHQSNYKQLISLNFGGPGGTRTPDQAVMSRRL